MKKLFAILLALTLALSLVACGGKDDSAGKDDPAPSQGNDAPLTREDGSSQSSAPEPENPSATNPAGLYDPNADFQSQLDSLNKNNLTPEQIAQIEAEAKADGMEVKWESDGSMTIVEDGSTVTTSGWPDNEFTKLIPTPKVGTPSAAEVTETDCTVVMTWTAEEAKAYAADLKDAGFTKSADEQDMADMGIYMYAASKDGVEVSVSFASGMGGINIVK